MKVSSSENSNGRDMERETCESLDSATAKVKVRWREKVAHVWPPADNNCCFNHQRNCTSWIGPQKTDVMGKQCTVTGCLSNIHISHGPLIAPVNQREGVRSSSKLS